MTEGQKAWVEKCRAIILQRDTWLRMICTNYLSPLTWNLCAFVWNKCPFAYSLRP
jgi:hypothetical protein